MFYMSIGLVIIMFFTRLPHLDHSSQVWWSGVWTGALAVFFIAAGWRNLSFKWRNLYYELKELRQQ